MTEMVKAKLNGEFEIILPKHRADREQWYTEEGWEKARLQAMHEHIGKGDLVYYVGAEEGEMCALCSMWGANVLLFEPNDRVMPNIREIYKHNGLKPATIIRGFAGNETTGDIEFAYVDQIEGEVIGDHGFKELHDPANDCLCFFFAWFVEWLYVWRCVCCHGDLLFLAWPVDWLGIGDGCIRVRVRCGNTDSWSERADFHDLVSNNVDVRACVLCFKVEII